MKPDILYVCTVPVTIELLMKGQIPYMKHRGLSVAVAASQGPELTETGNSLSVEAHPLHFKRAPSVFHDFLSMVDLIRLFLRLKPTIVHSSTSKAGPFAMVAGYLSRVPVRIYTLRGILVDRRNGPLKLVLKAVEWIGCHCAHQVIAVSPSVAEFVKTERLCSPDKIRVLGNGSSNGVDAEGLFNAENLTSKQKNGLRKRLGIAPTDEVIGFIGRLVQGKGIADLADVWRIIRKERPHVWLVVIGQSEDQAPVSKEILDEFRRDIRVIMIDSVDQRFLPAYYGIMHVLAFPSASEGFPNVALEAAAMEVPVVAYEVTGCVDAILDGETGALVTPGDVEAFANAVISYLADPLLSEKHGRAARRRTLDEYSPRLVWECLYNEYIDLLKRRGIDPPTTA